MSPDDKLEWVGQETQAETESAERWEVPEQLLKAISKFNTDAESLEKSVGLGYDITKASSRSYREGFASIVGMIEAFGTPEDHRRAACALKMVAHDIIERL